MNKNNETEDGSSSPPEEVTPGSAMVGRLIWAMAGPTFFLSLLIPMSKDPRWVGKWEAAYVANLLLMIWGRYLEQKSGHGSTLYDEPSTWSHFRKYTMKLLVLGIASWVCVKLAFAR